MIREYPAPHDPYDGSAEEMPIVKLWYGLLTDCLKRRCERIHIFPSDPTAPEVLIRPGKFPEIDELLADEGVPESLPTFTIRTYANGQWEDLLTPTVKMYAAFLQRLKVMASFSLAKRPLSEQGRFRFKSGDSVYEIGVTVRARSDRSQEAIVDLPTAPVEAAKQSS